MLKCQRERMRKQRFNRLAGLYGVRKALAILDREEQEKKMKENGQINGITGQTLFPFPFTQPHKEVESEVRVGYEVDEVRFYMGGKPKEGTHEWYVQNHGKDLVEE